MSTLVLYPCLIRPRPHCFKVREQTSITAFARALPSIPSTRSSTSRWTGAEQPYGAPRDNGYVMIVNAPWNACGMENESRMVMV